MAEMPHSVSPRLHGVALGRVGHDGGRGRGCRRRGRGSSAGFAGQGRINGVFGFRRSLGLGYGDGFFLRGSFLVGE